MSRFVMGFGITMCSVLAWNIALDMIDGVVDPLRYAAWFVSLCAVPTLLAGGTACAIQYLSPRRALGRGSTGDGRPMLVGVTSAAGSVVVASLLMVLFADAVPGGVTLAAATTSCTSIVVGLSCRRHRPGRCGGCGYDILGSLQFGRCPECGGSLMRSLISLS